MKKVQHQSLQDDRATAQSHKPTSNPLSCLQCRSRKVKCDRVWPACDRCVSQKESCTYPGTRQRAIGRRKTVKELEDRIEQLEELLRAATLGPAPDAAANRAQGILQPVILPVVPDSNSVEFDPSLPTYQDFTLNTVPMIQADDAELIEPTGNQIVPLGQFEQLPSLEIIDTLTTYYFQHVHSGAPLLHQAKYTAALRLPPHMRPPLCLQYIVMASAAATVDAYRHLAEPFFRRARVYAEADELQSEGQTFMTLRHVQAWCLISGYECHVHAHFTRASTSLCRSVRIAQMLKLHRLDIEDTGPMDWGPPLAPARDGIEMEERRRTWWVVFLADRFLAATTGWPSLIDEHHIRTNLPSSDASWAVGLMESAVALRHGLRELQDGRGTLISPLAFRVLAVNELLHALDHTAGQLEPNDGAQDSTKGSYWQRQQEIDNNLSLLTMFLPDTVRISENVRSLDAILVHMCNNMAIIQLHRTGLSLMQQYSLPAPLMAQSRERLLPAAEAILSIFRTAGDRIGVAILNPLLSFSAYMAATVFLDDVQSSETREERRLQSESNLGFLKQIFLFFGKQSWLVRTVAFQLATDMKESGYDTSMIEQVMSRCGTPKRAAFEILKSGSKRAPMLFCPALASALESSAFP